jgi:hypothetical protein
MSRADHLEWAKVRALEYVDAGEPQTAITSLMSDLSKHPGTASEARALVSLAVAALATGTDKEVREFIEGLT